MTTIPSPADATTVSARELVSYIRSHGGRVFRYVLPPKVFVLTTDPELAAWLVKRGGWPFVPTGWNLPSDGSYMTAPDGVCEWDIVITPIPVTDMAEVGHAIWKAAA